MTEPYIHIHNPQPDDVWCSVENCPTCQRPRRFYATHTPWYGVDWYCAGCGDHWKDGERLPRPFARGWRQPQVRWVRQKLACIGVQA